MKRIIAIPFILMLVALGCSKSEQTTTTTYAPTPTVTESTATAVPTETENISTMPPAAVPTATTASGVTKIPISLTPDFTTPTGVDPSQAPRLSIDAIEEEIKAGDVLLVDVRHPEAFQTSHAVGAVNIPLNEFPQRMGELPKEKYLVTYCT